MTNMMYDPCFISVYYISCTSCCLQRSTLINCFPVSAFLSSTSLGQGCDGLPILESYGNLYFPSFCNAILYHVCAFVYYGRSFVRV